MRALLFTMGLFALSACGRSDPSPSNETPLSGKVEGPPVNALTRDQLQLTLAECMQYGRMDDPRVKYTDRYCSAVMSAHLSEGYAKSAHSDVDPSLNRLH